MNSKNRKTARESNKNKKTSSQRCFRNKKMKEVKILKLKDLITLQNILFVKDSLTNEGMTSFDIVFQQFTTTPYQNTK